MLSAETAVGQYPIEAVAMMDRIARRVQQDPLYFTGLDAAAWSPSTPTSDAISAAACQVAATVGAAAIVSFTSSGATALRAARERPAAPILVMTPNLGTARRLALALGRALRPQRRHPRLQRHGAKGGARRAPRRHRRGRQRVVITAGVPFGTPGATNILRIAWVDR